jgi:hypothetical protein
MNMKKLYALFSGLLFTFSLAAQQEIPLLNNRILKEYQLDLDRRLPAPIPEARPRAKVLSCAVPEPGVTYVEAGRTATAIVQIDTFGLGRTGAYSCLNCDGAPGTASVSGRELTFTAAASVVADPYDFIVSYCNNGECRNDTIPFIAKRAGLHYYPPLTVMDAEESRIIEADVSRLPGALVCNRFADCPDDYEGRNQLAYFTTYQQPDHRFVYKAARYAGLDSVCVVLCDAFTICDTFHFAFRIQQDTLGLPFMDDFSYAGPFPDGVRWLDEDTYVNNTLANEPPSVGVATFDGVNYRGDVYGGGYGPSDRLTSNYISLKSAQNDVYLSYWVQRRGLGDRPEIQDSLVLEFKDRDGRWQYVRSFAGAPASQPNTTDEPFRFYRDKLGANFIHNAFQFRFTNYSDRNGILDNWHVDYVRLSDQVSQNDNLFRDVAFTQYPLHFLRYYSSMPWNHFKGFETAELRDTIAVALFNHAGEALNASPSNFQVTELTTDTDLLRSDLILFNGTEANIPAREPVKRSYLLQGDPTGFPSIYASLLLGFQNPSFDQRERLEFATQYSLNNTTQINASGLEAVQRNDRVEKVTVFENYFAYDDGTAESGFIAQEGNSVALRFLANVPDSLRGVSIHFPRTTIDASDQRFTLKVWVGELDEEPEYEVFLETPYYANSFYDTLQGFTTYPLLDRDGNPAPLALEPGYFYVGWEQETPCTATDCIAVGYDRNTPAAKENTFFRSATGWTPLDSLVFTIRGGALMIRPIVGSETPVATPTGEVPVILEANVYPNPTQQWLNIDLPDGRHEQYRYLLYNSVGQALRQGRLERQIDLGNLPSGLYYFRIFDPVKNQSRNFKVVKSD